MDTMDNATWDKYMHLPNASFVIGKDGKVTYRELWAFRPNGHGPRSALEEVVGAMTQK
jgi:hypothetical protein